MEKIRSLLAAPVFPGDERKTYRAQLVRTALVVEMVFTVLTFWGNVLGGRTPVGVLVVDALFFTSAILLFVLLKVGYLELVEVSGIAVMIILLTFGIAALGTVRDPSTAFYLLIIIVAGYLFGTLGVLITAVISSVSVLGLILAESSGWLPPADLSVTITQWIVYTLYFCFGAYLALMAYNSIQRALERAGREVAERTRAEQAARESERKFRSIVEQSSDGILMIDGMGRIMVWNRGMGEIMGRKADEMLGRLVWEVDLPLLPAEEISAGQYQQLQRRIAQSGPSGKRGIARSMVEKEVTLAEGQRKVIEYSIFSVEMQEQFWIGGILRDVTERQAAAQKLQESERRWQFALEGLGEGVWDFDYVHNRVFLSPQWVAMLGYEEGEFGREGDTFMRLVHPEDYARVEDENQRILEGKLPEFEREVRLRCKDGSYKSILARGKVMTWDAQGRPLRSIGTHRDITDLKRAREELRNREHKLAALQERERLARDLHDGLGQTLGYLNVQAQATETMIDQQQLAAARANLRRMAEMAGITLNDLRNYILGLRLPASQFISFQQALEAYLEKFSQEAGIPARLSYPPGMPARLFAPAVEEQVLRIVQEALINVRKHAGASQVQVIVSASRDTIQVIIADDGRGFSPGEQGVGAPHFGLDMMDERAQQIGGRLEVRTAPGKGAQVILFVPRLVEAEVSRKITDVEKIRVLLVDDHPLFMEGMRNLLNARGVTVVGTAENGLQAVEQARSLRPDVVLMDVQMPVCGGVEAARLIKAELPEVKIMMLTVSEAEEDLSQALRNGASGYLLKSLDANRLCQMLLDVVNGETPLPPKLAARMLSETAQNRPRSPTRKSDIPLSDHQWEILNLVADGLLYKEVASQLGLSEQTVKYHMKQILEHLHLENREEAIAYVQRVNRGW